MISNQDKRQIEELRKHFQRFGVVETEVDSFKKGDNLETIIKEANEVAKYERELNPDFYDAELEKEMSKQVYKRTNFMIDNC